MSCPCCGRRDGLSSGGCLHCVARVFCACGQLLACGCGQAIAEHHCPNVVLTSTLTPTSFITPNSTLISTGIITPVPTLVPLLPEIA